MTVLSDVVSIIGHMNHKITAYLFGDESLLLRTALADVGLRCAALDRLNELADLEPASSLVVAVASPVRPKTSLALVNAACVAHGITWLPIGAFEDGVAHVGPLVAPGASACYDCLTEQPSDTLEYRAGSYRELEGRPAQTVPPPGLDQWRLSVAALIVQRWIHAHDLRLAGQRFTISTDELTINREWAPRSALCQTCESGRVG